jgi:hypothetical protein
MSSPQFHLTAIVADVVGAVIDAAGVMNRMEAVFSASRAVCIEEARQLLVVTESDSNHAGRNEWSVQDAARRMLVAELATELRLPENTVHSLVTDSELLVNHLPVTLATLSRGEISWQHAHYLADHAGSVPAESRAGFEQRVLPYALTHTATRFNRYAREQRERLHPETIEERHESAVERRSLSIQPGSDGMVWLTAHLAAPIGHAIIDRITHAALRAASDGDQRSIGQLGADVFAAALLGSSFADLPGLSGASGASGASIPLCSSTYPMTEYLAAPDLRTILAEIRPSVHVTVPILTLLDRGEEPAILDGYGPIDAETASLLASNAPSFMRLLTHPETGVVLSVGRDRYEIPAGLRRWLQIRDGTCRFPGCGRAAVRCDVDHTQEWHDGGDTAHNNLAHLCRKHHRLKSLTDWKVEQVGDGALRWTSPFGQVYITEPEELIAPARPDPPQEVPSRAA